jgi:hypothetical protein
MIVWGGAGGLATGGRYDPAANTWTSTAAVGAGFTGRFGHAAVWTGTEMIIWGGTNGTSYYGNGLRYNPASNTWSPMSASGAPSARAFASVAWTGTEMIVWGGADGSAVGDTLEGGARYNPATNTWSPISPSGEPGDRRLASSVWTGTELILWGGDPNGNALLDGGRYIPKTVCGTGGCQRTGHMVCSAGTQSFQCVPQPSSPEICDGVDNDCNVLVDDGIPVPSGHPSLQSARITATTNQWSWSATGGTTSYDFTRGSLIALHLSLGQFSGTAVECLANDTTALSFQDTLTPAQGDSLWYLVRPVNACSGNGTYEDNVSRDASINLSPTRCP